MRRWLDLGWLGLGWLGLGWLGLGWVGIGWVGIGWVGIVGLGMLALPRGAHAQGGPFVNFETIPTRAVALSPDGSRLFVTNTPDGRLEIFQVTAAGLTPVASVPVGLDPVAVNARTDSEVWVVNLLSDSVSIVDVAATPPRVFDATNLGEKLGGAPLNIDTLFGDKPGSMDVSPDGSRVFVALATSGNETTTISPFGVCGMNGRPGSGQFSRQNDGPCTLRNGGTGPGGVPGPNVNQVDGAMNPRTGLIAKFDRQTGAWLDVLGRDWRDAVPFTLPDTDVFVLDANANPPVQVGSFAHVGTLNAGVAAHPTNGKTYVATIEAMNLNRFISVPRLGAFPNPDRVNNAARTADPAASPSAADPHTWTRCRTALRPRARLRPRTSSSSMMSSDAMDLEGTSWTLR